MKFNLSIITITLLFCVSCSQKLVPVKKNNLYGYETKSGKNVIKHKYLSAQAFKEKRARISQMRSVSDSIWRPAIFGAPGYWRHDTYKVEKFAFVTKRDSIISDFYYEADDFNEGLAAVRKQKYWGYIDLNGRTAIPFKFVDAKSFNNGKAIVSEEDPQNPNWWYDHIINSKGEYIEKNIKSYEKPNYIDSLDDWTVVLASAQTYVQLTDYGSASEYFHSLTKRLDQILKEDTFAALTITTEYAYLKAQIIDDVTWKKYHDKSTEIFNLALQSGTENRRVLLVYIDYLVEMVYLRELNAQFDMQKEMMALALDAVKKSGTENIENYWDLQEKLDEWNDDHEGHQH